MHKLLFLAVLAGGLLAGGVVFADHGEEAEVEAVEQAESVTLADLEVQDPGLLPTSPLYFFKEWSRGVQSFFTFNSIAKAELEVKFSNEKAAELKVVQEQRPEDSGAIERALSNFERSQERLKARLEGVQETSENPNVDRLFDSVAEKSILHEKLLEELKERHEDKEAVRVKAGELKEQVLGAVQGLAELDTPEKFAERVRSALENTPGSAFKHIRSVEFIDQIQDKLPKAAQERLEGVREGLKERIEERIEIEGEDGEKLKAIFEKIPGDASRRAVVLEEIRVKVSDKAADALEKVQERVEEKISDSADRKEKAEEQIRRAGEMIAKAQEKAREKDEVREAAKELISQAERHLALAKQAFAKEDFGEAFGQARAAEVAARNALRALEEKDEEPASVLKRVQDRIQERTKLPEATRLLPPVRESDKPAACGQEHKPVCGVDGKTYSNRCVAEQQNRVKVAKEGECGEARLSPDAVRTIEDRENKELQNQDSRQLQLQEQLQEQLLELNTLQKQLEARQGE